MKRLFCGVLMIFVLVFSACSPRATEPVVSGFRCQIAVVYGGTEYQGTFERPATEAATLTLSKPSALSGLKMEWNGSEVAVQYLGMEMKVGEDELPVGAVIRVLCEALDACGQNAATSRALTVEGESACGPFVLTLDDTGYPLRLEIPAVAFTADFGEWETASNNV